MRILAIGAAAFAAMLASASPAAAQAVDQDMVCMMAMAETAEGMGSASDARVPYDRAGGYYLHIVAKRYPTPELFAPPLKLAGTTLHAGDRSKIADKCVHAIDPELDLILKSLDILGL